MQLATRPGRARPGDVRARLIGRRHAAMVRSHLIAHLAALGAVRRECGGEAITSVARQRKSAFAGHRGETLAGEHPRSEEHTSELQSLMRISYAVFCLKNKIRSYNPTRKAERKSHTSEIQDRLINSHADVR